MSDWTADSWQNFSYPQSVSYADKAHLHTVLQQLNALPPLVTVAEIKRLKQAIAQAARGEIFLLQGGDCAETFAACEPLQISSKLKILLQMSLIFLYKLEKPVLRIGRIAGQYCKPRSSETETVQGLTLPSYRGDMINAAAFTPAARMPNPKLLLDAYHCSAITLNFIRGLLSSGFANLDALHEWQLNAACSPQQEKKYREIVTEISKIQTIMHTSKACHPIEFSAFFTSHEALHLHYEQAFTRQDSNQSWYNLSTHLPWIGVRTGQLESAHLELLRGIQNPVGIKIGPLATVDWLLQIICRLNPNNEEGRILLISRLGQAHIERVLPPLIRAVKAKQLNVAWTCDPMHGNTETTALGIKTRHFDNIVRELHLSYLIHRAHDSHLAGVHLELTGDNVTECIGGSRGLTSEDLQHAYQSLVDPRLNYEQSLEIAFACCQIYSESSHLS